MKIDPAFVSKLLADESDPAAAGVNCAELEAMQAQYAEFERMYANPLLRNPRFLPARA